MKQVHTIILYPRPHLDVVIALLLLRMYGEEVLPGVSTAPLEFHTLVDDTTTPEEYESQGKLLLDIGGGRFDHHTQDGDRTQHDSASMVVAKELGIHEQEELQKILNWAQRDEIKGKGVLSTDRLDRTFSIPSLILALHRQHIDDPAQVFEKVLPLLEAHIMQEYRRCFEIPEEWEAAQEEGRATTTTVNHGGKKISVVHIATDNMEMAGYLRSLRRGRADVVAQLLSSGHVNILTRQKSEVDLQEAAAALRAKEADVRKIDISHLASTDLHTPGRIDEIPQWFFDTASKTVQNGGIITDSVEATQIPQDEVVEILLQSLASAAPQNTGGRQRGNNTAPRQKNDKQKNRSEDPLLEHHTTDGWTTR